jgi:hypothetical protein
LALIGKMPGCLTSPDTWTIICPDAGTEEAAGAGVSLPGRLLTTTGMATATAKRRITVRR